MNALQQKSLETGYRVRYECACGCEWTGNWSCACDDECSNCGATIEAAGHELDGTYTEAELDHYNRTGALPAGAAALHAAHEAKLGDPLEPAGDFATWLELQAMSGNSNAANYLKDWA